MSCAYRIASPLLLMEESQLRHVRSLVAQLKAVYGKKAEGT